MAASHARKKCRHDSPKRDDKNFMMVFMLQFIKIGIITRRDYMPNHKLALVFLFLMVSSAWTQKADVPELPLSIPDEQIQPLRSTVEAKLQAALERRLNRNRSWAKLIGRKDMAVGLVDLSDAENIKFARVNGNVMLYAASLPKIAILLAASQGLEDGKVQETPEVMDDLRIMISKSDNRAATRMIDRVGGFRKIESVLRDPRYDLYDPNWGGGLWVGKRYSKDARRYPDPVLGTSHGATVSQVCRFYYLLAIGKLVSRERSKQMLDMLVDPEINHKFVHTLHTIAPQAKLYRKSGSWSSWHSDSVLVWGPKWRRYIVVALIEDPGGERILRDLIPAVEEVLKSQSKKRG